LALRPGDAEPAQFARNFGGARGIVRERVIIKEYLFHLQESADRPAHLFDDVGDAARAVAVAAYYLRPKAERARDLQAWNLLESPGGEQIPSENPRCLLFGFPWISLDSLVRIGTFQWVIGA